MNKDLLHWNLIKIASQLSTEQLFEARENRNWETFDKLDEMGKLQWMLEEFEIFEDIIDHEYEPDLRY